jgi:Spy/CpxP family protein refolding chaperone
MQAKEIFLMQRFVGLVTLLAAATVAVAQPQTVQIGTSYGAIVVPGFLPPVMDPSDPAAYWTSVLGLDAGQQAGIKAILAQRQTAGEAARANLEQARAALAAGAKANSADAELERLSTDLANTFSQAVAAEAKAFAKFYALLTADQKQKFDKLAALPPAGGGLTVFSAVTAGGPVKQ